MFTSVRRCAEPITQRCRLKVEVTTEGYLFEPLISLSVYLSFTPESISIKFCQMFASVKRCAEYITQPCRQVRSIKIMGLNLEFRVRSISLLSLKVFSSNFGQIFALVRQCAEYIIQTCQLNLEFTSEGHEFEPLISCRFYIAITPERIFIKI